MVPPAADRAPRRLARPEQIAAAALFLATIAAFWGVRGNKFITSIDDNWYITENPVVAKGLSAEGVWWAFTSVRVPWVANWHPLTWLSHMLDVQLFGMDAGGHHLTSVLIHALSAALLFRLLRGLTGATGRSAAVAALFALHPLRVESVAWAAERKDVLSGLFFMLTLLAYLGWARRPRLGRYLAALACFALGLLSKPMIVTVPFVLLLLDFWPLGRLRFPALRHGSLPGPAVPCSRLLLEKAPYLALAAASSAITLVAQADAIARSLPQSFPVRLLNAVHSYGVYLGKAAWPSDLMIFYPHPGAGLAPWRALSAGVLLAAITLLTGLAARSRPYLATGWLWYLGMLVPVIGLVQQSGSVAMADRYTYLPLIGASLAVAWGLHGLFPAWRSWGKALAAATASGCLLLAFQTARQVKTMRDDETLYRHMLSVDPSSHYALNNLGVVLIGQGRRAEGATVLGGMYRLTPAQLLQSLLQSGAKLSMSGKADEALVSYAKALALDPSNTEASRTAALLRSAGARMPPGTPPSWTPQALLDEEEARIWLMQGDALAASEHFQYAVDYYRQAVKLKPDFTDAWNNLGSCYGRLGRHQEAAEAFERAVAADPGNARARTNLEQARRSLRR